MLMGFIKATTTAVEIAVMILGSIFGCVVSKGSDTIMEPPPVPVNVPYLH
jgi:hypothetical protein